MRSLERTINLHCHLLNRKKKDRPPPKPLNRNPPGGQSNNSLKQSEKESEETIRKDKVRISWVLKISYRAGGGLDDGDGDDVEKRK